MRVKPWPLVILALLHALSPVQTVMLSASLLDVPLTKYMGGLWHHGTAHDWFSLLLFPIAGYAIFAVEKWSYRVYLGVMAAITLNNVYLWRTFPVSVGWALGLSIQFVNVLIVTYFLNPRLRTLYFTPALQWWKSQPRYPANFRCKVTREGTERSEAEAVNISVGGMLLRTRDALSPGDRLQLRIVDPARFEPLEAQVIHFMKQQDVYGLRFVHTKETRGWVSNLIKSLIAAGVQPCVKISRLEDLKLWAKTLVLTGRGLWPELPSPRAPQKTDQEPSLRKAS